MKIISNPKLPVKKDGIYSGIDISVYHSAECTDGYSVSSSNLRKAWKPSMRHMYSQWAHNPNRIESGDTKWMRFGRAAHHLLLGEDDFSTLFVQEPEKYRDKVTAEEKPWNNNAGVCKAWHAEMKKFGRTVLKPADMAKIKPIVASLRLDPLVQADALVGLVEHSLIAKHPETGLWLKARPDVIPNDGAFVDLKFTSDITDLGVMMSLRSFGYHMQGALVWMVCDLLKIPFESFTLFLVESEEPHCVRAVPITEDDLARGRLQCEAMIRRVASCIEAGHWPGPGEGDLRALPLPMRDREEIDIQLKNLGLL